MPCHAAQIKINHKIQEVYAISISFKIKKNNANAITNNIKGQPLCSAYRSYSVYVLNVWHVNGVANRSRSKKNMLKLLHRRH